MRSKIVPALLLILLSFSLSGCDLKNIFRKASITSGEKEVRNEIPNPALNDRNGESGSSGRTNETVTPQSTASAEEISVEYKLGPTLKEARMGHFQMTLSDGRIALFGGHGKGFASLSTVEVINKDLTESVIYNMRFPHDFGVFSTLENGEVLLGGGSADLGVPKYGTSEIFNQKTTSFKETGNMVKFKAGAGSAQLKDGRVLSAGAWWTHNDANNYGETYDPETGKYSETGKLVKPRAYAIVLPTDDGGAVVLGGTGAQGTPAIVNEVEKFDPKTSSFSLLQKSLFKDETDWGVHLSHYQRPISAQKLSDGKYLLYAYKSDGKVTKYALFTFDPKTILFKKIETKPSLPDSSTISLLAPIVGTETEEVFLIGASTDTPTKVSLYRINTNNWEVALSKNSFTLPDKYLLSGVTASVSSDGRILLTGGNSEGGYSTNFSPISNTLIIDPK